MTSRYGNLVLFFILWMFVSLSPSTWHLSVVNIYKNDVGKAKLSSCVCDVTFSYPLSNGLYHSLWIKIQGSHVYLVLFAKIARHKHKGLKHGQHMDKDRVKQPVHTRGHAGVRADLHGRDALEAIIVIFWIIRQHFSGKQILQ